MPNLTIDGHKINVPEGTTILEAARSLGIKIPTLCHSEVLAPYGACRLCLVEINSAGRNRIVASCTYPAEEGLSVESQSPAVLKGRRFVVELLLAKSPEAEVVRALALQMGIGSPRFTLEPSDCILCALCTRACKEIVGVSAIGMANRGERRKAMPPYEEASGSCISCGTCTTICPTGAIDLKKIDRFTMVHSWEKASERRLCKICGIFHPGAEFCSNGYEWLQCRDATIARGQSSE